MKITIYTITDCQFSRQEKEYLKSHNLPFEEKNLELNKEWLTEMLAISDNFAGTPVTRIEKDDGAIRIFKGFTKEEFDEFLSFSQNSQPNQTPAPAQQQTQTNQQQTPTDQQINSKLNDVLNQLEQKTENTSQLPQTPPADEQNPADLTNSNSPINTSNSYQSIAPQSNPEQPQNQQPQNDSPPPNIPNIPDFPSDLKT
ncbi:MAG: glutaredoxin family protein [Patescibacteria group bacterium]|nr:glutaredoxin family protein [Patescibacteria group bacterium]